MQLHILNPSTNAIESRITVNSVGQAKEMVHVHESNIDKTHAVILSGDPRLQRDVTCISAYDGEWHIVGTKPFCG